MISNGQPNAEDIPMMGDVEAFDRQHKPYNQTYSQIRNLNPGSILESTFGSIPEGYDDDAREFVHR